LLGGSMHNTILLPEFKEIIETRNWELFKDIVEDLHPAEIAELISALEPEEIWQLLDSLDIEHKAAIFSHLDINLQVEITDKISRQQLAALLTAMPSDDRVDLFKKFPEEKQENILPAIEYAEREDIRRLASYPEKSAGSVMTSKYASVPVNITVDEAIRRLRILAPNKETIYYCYVLNDKRQLVGIVSLTDLILADPKTLVNDIMMEDFIYAKVYEDQEEAAKKIQKYDLLAIPVVDDNMVLLGIITHDDAFDIITQEQTEDIEKLMAIAGSHEAGVYLQTPVWVHFKNRAVWIVSLAALGLISGIIIHSYENALASFMILALYMPMVADTGGNVGSQSATVIVRAIALGEVQLKHIFRVLGKEFLVSALLALVLGVLAWLKVMYLSSDSDIPSGFNLSYIAFAIAIALSIQVITATLIGALLPLLAKRFNQDPAVVASPALTTIVDITGLLIYFNTAKLLLGF